MGKKEHISIAERCVGLNQPPFMIAEMSGNHNQSLKKALEIVDAAADSGADAIKLQTYTADSLTLNVKNESFKIVNQVYGKEKIFTIYIKNLTLLGNGTKQFLKEHVKEK